MTDIAAYYRYADAIPEAVKTIKDLPPGTYKVSDLYQRYLSLTDRDAPISKVALGQAFGQLGLMKSRVNDGFKEYWGQTVRRQVSAWKIPEGDRWWREA